MGTASIVMRDAPDGGVEMECVFDPHFDRTSQSHIGIRMALKYFDSLGIQIKDAPAETSLIQVANYHAH